jgi:hypothetical protein
MQRTAEEGERVGQQFFERGRLEVVHQNPDSRKESNGVDLQRLVQIGGR